MWWPNAHRTLALVASLGALAMGCSNDSTDDGAGGEAPEEGCHTATLDAALCDPAVASFSLGSSNPYYPLLVGSEVVLEGFDDEEGVALRVERTVSADTMTVMGVQTHILEHRTYHDGEIHEIAYNFYVEADDGTVCYFGEDVEFYEGGMLANTDGTWRAGVDGASPGIIMPASPATGQAYFQENAPDNEALDMGKVEAVGETATFDGTSYDDVLTIQDSSPFDDCEDEEKRYIPGIGEVKDVELELIEYTPPPAG